MSKRTTDVVPQQAGTLPVPDYVAKRGKKSLDVLKEFVRPSMVKIIQKQSSNELLDMFGMGTAILTPGRTRLGDLNTPILITPIYFYPEFAIHNPWELRSRLPRIRKRTLDPHSEIALRSRDPDSWAEPCPEDEQYSIRWVEHLNFLVYIHGVTQPDEAALMSFFIGEAETGRTFCAKVKNRQADMFTGVYQAVPALRPERNGNQWYGWDIVNPPEDISPWAKEEQIVQFEELYKFFKQKHESQAIVADYEEEEDKETVTIDM